MSNNINTFESDLAAAREIMSGLKVGSKRTLLVNGFLSAETDEARQEYVDEKAAGNVRHDLRQMAIRMERAGRQDDADVFWALRDDIDEDGFVFVLDADAA